MFIAEITPYNGRYIIHFKNCGPQTSDHTQYGDRVYRGVSEASRQRLIRWANDGHWVSTGHNGNWWNLTRMNAKEKLVIARQEQATHQSALDPGIFYKKREFDTLEGKFENGKLVWRYWGTYPPEWSKVL